jgi:hypothetical protein
VIVGRVNTQDWHHFSAQAGKSKDLPSLCLQLCPNCHFKTILPKIDDVLSIFVIMSAQEGSKSSLQLNKLFNF